MNYLQMSKTDIGFWETKQSSKGTEEVKEVPRASKETMEKLNAVLAKLGDARRASFERLYRVDKRGYWGEWSALNCISKLEGEHAN